MTHYTYTAYGLTIISDFELPELLPLPPQDLPENAVRIRRGEVPDELDDPVGTGVLYQAKPNEFLLRLDAIAGYYVTDGREIVVEPVPGATDDEVQLFLLGSALGALLHQRGLLVMHASAIETPMGAILISGTSGSGKSTLAAALWRRGYRLLADDVCAVAPKPDGTATPIVLPGYPQTKLWADTTRKLALDLDSLRRVRPQLDKYAVPLEAEFSNQSLPLYAVYLLQTHNKAGASAGTHRGCPKARGPRPQHVPRSLPGWSGHACRALQLGGDGGQRGPRRTCDAAHTPLSSRRAGFGG